MFKRVFILVLVLVALFSFSLFSFADSEEGNYYIFDWTNHINTYVRDGEYITVYVNLPTSYTVQKVYSSLGTLISIGDNVVSIDSPQSIYTDYIFFLGENGYLDMSNVPEDTEIEYQWYYIVTNGNQQGSAYGELRTVYYNEVGGNAYNQYNSSTISAPANTVLTSSSPLIYNSNNSSCLVQPYFRLANLTSPSDVLTIYLNTFSLKFTSDALDAIFPEIPDNTNALLQELIEQNKEILNGSPEDLENSEIEQGIANEKTEHVNDLNDYISSVQKPSIDEIDDITNPDNILSDFSINAINNSFGSIFNSAILVNMLLLVVTCSLISYVLFGKK